MLANLTRSTPKSICNMTARLPVPLASHFITFLCRHTQLFDVLLGLLPVEEFPRKHHRDGKFLTGSNQMQLKNILLTCCSSVSLSSPRLHSAIQETEQNCFRQRKWDRFVTNCSESKLRCCNHRHCNRECCCTSGKYLDESIQRTNSPLYTYSFSLFVLCCLGGKGFVQTAEFRLKPRAAVIRSFRVLGTVQLFVMMIKEHLN